VFNIQTVAHAMALQIHAYYERMIESYYRSRI